MGRLCLDADGIGMIWVEWTCTRAVGCVFRFRFSGDFVDIGEASRVMYLRRRNLMDHIGLCVCIRAVEVLGFSLAHRRVRVRMKFTEILQHGRWTDAAHVGRVIVKVRVLRRGRLTAKGSAILRRMAEPRFRRQ